jgi:alpha-galactosidase
MVKIAYIGAGSRIFTVNVITDIITYPALRKETQIALMDINETRLNFTLKQLELYKEEHLSELSGVEFTATTDQRSAIKDAKYVIASFLVGGPAVYQYDLDIPMKYGVSQCIGDSMGPGGVFRFLRSVPVYRDIMQNMKEIGYNAGEKKGGRPLFLNYTNPMAMNTWYCNELWPDSTVGLCHGVQGTADMLRRYIGAASDEFQYTCAGINHMAWFIDLKFKDRNEPNSTWKDGYPIIWQNFQDEPEIVGDEKLRWDMMKATGYYMTESSGHLSEYVPYYRKRKDLIDKFAGSCSGFNNLEQGWDQQHYTAYQQELNQKAEEEKLDHIPFKLHPSLEYASGIINGMETDIPFPFNGNLINKEGGLITNLPKNCCVEVPCTASFAGIRPQGGIELPPVCQGLCLSNIMVQQAAVKAALKQDRELLYHAILLDPNTASVCSPEEIKIMVDEMFEAQRKDTDWLNWWEN